MFRILIIIFILFFNISNNQAQIGFDKKLSAAAIELCNDVVTYDPSYYTIKYPNGDVPKGSGVCTDVVIRAY